MQFEAAQGASTVEADGDVLIELAVPCAPLQLRLRGASLSLPPAPRADMRVSVEGRLSGGGSEWVGTVSAAFDDAAAPARGGSGKVRSLASGDAAARGTGFYAAASDGAGATLDVVARRGAIRVRFALFEELAARSARKRAGAKE